MRAAMPSSKLLDGPSIDDYWWGFVAQAKIAYNDALARGELVGAVEPSRYRGGTMPRPPKDDNATQKLKPEDETQRAKEGTKIGLLRRGEVLADFRKIARKR